MRGSVNRQAGTLETKPVNLTKDVYPTYIVNKVLPEIIAKWPDPSKIVILQHDNARAQVTPHDSELRGVFASYKDEGWSIFLKHQPPNSPDTNILDLGFFAAIQSLQYRTSARSIDQLVANTMNAFINYPHERA
ncbi:hypothetical protein AeRB84_006286 [Aphanomyces euteiches]|nr:hypothetical protein AeRB84_006286 [Aphanomyces euteiches]